MAALLNPRLWFYLAAACAIAFVLAFTYRAGKANVRADFDKYRIAQQETRILADKAQRAEEQRRQTAVDQEATHAQERITALQADVGAANAAAARLHAAIGAAVSGARKGASTATAGKGEQGGDAIDVLAKLYAESDSRAGEVALFADRLRIAGQACEAAYDALK